MSATTDVITELHATLAENDGLHELLTRSVVRARERAESDLDPDLFEALDWPCNLQEYEQYLRSFLSWIPIRSVPSP